MTLQENNTKLRKKTIINDSIWGPIELSDTSWKIINTPEFQRLRFIKQLGGCYFVYPGACHNRFEHSIGTAHLARTLGIELQKNQPELDITEKDIECLEIAGLCHDLGHGAFSHLFDLQFIKKARPGYESEHEDASLKMLDRIFKIFNLEELSENSRTFIKELIKKPEGSYKGRSKEKHFLYEVVANDVNKIDVDKWDYFSRDCHMLGLHHNFQCQRSIKIARVIEHDGERHISFPKSEYLNIFDMFSTRYTLHRQAYQHQATRAVQTMISDAFYKADNYLTFPPNTPKEKGGKTLSESVDDMNAYLWVMDDVFHTIRTLPEDNENIKQAKTILDRILSRDFYKMIGEKKVQLKDKNQKDKNFIPEVKLWMEGKIKNNLDPTEEELELFEIQDLTFNYGNKDKNPMDKVYFFHGTKGAVKLKENEVSLMMPSTFEQIYLQLVWKGSKGQHPELKMKILKTFEGIKEYPEENPFIELIDTKESA